MHLSYTYSTHSDTESNINILFGVAQVSDVLLVPREAQHLVYALNIILNLNLFYF